ncbi:hypothetical protein IGI04_019671 [Brassica rapa subsp. trilocularis]|uniref:Peptidase A1 domain-containing protein n=1 Tax=Brassica rapa subsp. trilocularis TaxID=1813537 RepID=A0ABQ7MGW5_BRACM|nr:hypothetical protein IGI04_019671 [Brassica rapa subsp. trilocularis]
MFGRLCQIKWHSHRATVHKLIAVKSASGQTTVGIDPQVMPRSGGMAIFRGCLFVVVKVNGFTHFKKKRNSIVAFGSGYSNSSNDQNPIVYIEDTTRKAHK